MPARSVDSAFRLDGKIALVTGAGAASAALSRWRSPPLEPNRCW
jgi:hypothetical protein